MHTILLFKQSSAVTETGVISRKIETFYAWDSEKIIANFSSCINKLSERCFYNNISDLNDIFQIK